MEYIKYIQDIEGVSRPVKDAELSSAMETVTEITLTASGWSSSNVQTVSVSGVTADSVFDVGILYPDSCTRSTQKAINKAAGLIYAVESGSNSVTFRATEKPTTDIPLGIRGIV